MDISLHISKLIVRYDYVIIPGFGGFVSNYEPAQVHRVQQVISPPAKSIAFNKNLTSNDGLLVNFISKEENISVNKAQEWIRKFSDKSRRSLQNKEIVLLPGLGKLFLDLDENLQFVQDKNFNHLLQSFGLPDVPGKVVMRKQIIDTNIGLRDEDYEEERTGRRRLWYYAAAGFFLLVLGLGSIALLDEKANRITCNLLGISTENNIPATPPPPPATEAMAAADHILVLNIFPQQEEDQMENAEEAEHVVLQKEENISPAITVTPAPATNISNGAIPKGYFVVIGSFTREKNVSRLYQKLAENNQVSYRIPGEGNFTRIGIYISGDIDEVQKKLDSLRTVYDENAWILRNK